MSVQEEIKKYISSQPEPKRSDIQELHRLTLQVSPECKLWFFDGKNSKKPDCFPLHRYDLAVTSAYRAFRRGILICKVSTQIRSVVKAKTLEQNQRKVKGEAETPTLETPEHGAPEIVNLWKEQATRR